MSQVLIGFTQQQPPSGAELCTSLADLGIMWSGRDRDHYRQGTWNDVRTRARCVLDLGEPDLERDDMHPPTRYENWAEAGITIHIPLAGPHWQAVECYRVAEAVGRLGITLLDTEDVHEYPDSRPAPFPFTRARALLSWEHLREAQTDGLAIQRLNRPASITLWRWRREAPADAGGLVVIADNRRPGTALLAGVIQDASRPAILPAVDVVLIMTPNGPVTVPGEQLLHLSSMPASAGGLRYQDLRPLLAAVDPAAGRFKVLADEDWRD